MTLRPRSETLEPLVFLHVAVLLVGSSWAFGGNIGWARLALSAWASLALPLAIALLSRPDQAGVEARSRLPWLIPPALYAALVCASAFNPSFRPVVLGSETLLVHRGEPHPGWPGTVSPAASLKSLWFGAGLYLSAFNLVLAANRRSRLRWLLGLVVVNAAALAVYGTLQKLTGSGFYFGAIESPNKRFFATFIYNNHWGAFMILCLAASLALLFYMIRRHGGGRALWRSPFGVLLVATVLIAATAPISASRAATLMAAALAIIAMGHATLKIIRGRRLDSLPVWPPVVAMFLSVALVLAAAGWLASRSISERYADTRETLQSDQGLWAGRMELYRDSWDLAMRKPVFGWGLDGYETAFQLIHPRPLMAHRHYERSYATAHNDWLQSVAETGFVGTLLLALTIALPLASLRGASLRHPLIFYPLAGLAITLLYALVEFPFSSGAFLALFWTSLFVVVRQARLQSAA